MRADTAGDGVRILLVNSAAEARSSLATAIEAEGYEVVASGIAEQALRLAAKEVFDIIIADPGIDPDLRSAGTVRAFKAVQPESTVILTGGKSAGPPRIDVLRAGAFQSIGAPVHGAEVVFEIGRALEYRELVRQNRHLRRQIDAQSQPTNLVGSSTAMVEVRKRIALFADSRSPLLIQGERGTGKSLLASIIHHSGPRRSQPFVAVNCRALAGALLEAELFGPARGFSGGMRRSALEEANGGTVYLEEISEMGRAVQKKFLRMVEEHRLSRAANTPPLPLDIRIIAASTSRLADSVKRGDFRQDLFFHLRVMEITLPPLRDRVADIAPLAAHFLKERERLGEERCALSAEALTVLESYGWPGNVRELEQAVEFAVTQNRSGVLTPEDFPPEVRGDFYRGTRLEDLYTGLPSLRELGERYLAHVLRVTGGNKAGAAAILGVSRKTLYSMAARARKRSGRPRKSRGA